MSNKRFTSLIQIFVLILGAVVAIAQPAQSHTGSQYPGGIEGNLQISFLDFIFPKRKARPRGPRNPSRAPFDESLPYVLTPRNTALMGTNSLTFQWHPVEGATSYTVEIDGRNVDWEVEVTGTEAVFDEVASIVVNYRYTIVITTNEGISSKLGEPVGFVLLPETESDRVNAQVEAIKAEQLEPDEEALAIALKYLEFEHSALDWRSYALNQAAIDVLESRIQAGTEDSRVYLLQADTYLRVGLPLLARERYGEALNRAEVAAQPELQAESHWGLADVAKGQTEYEDALAHFQRAHELYEGLGDLEQAEELQIQIDEVEMQLPRPL
ncbi:tetratricopeptide repeat protein [Leptothoe sp. PORK10 BA2]|uniref:tetratricopeptide repeat protein n=1 Tax=Leptothoe sp. PORK10 BA2 TaxID=3110254 RepID=UPI002B21CBC3|nr:tetratricopeptide repeat protein [Leptothoe sp. PORK10 BA2]MEA5464993.1 tetratricopeptide repeat protein [Leptothoe sp. PORK10 BA2]